MAEKIARKVSKLRERVNFYFQLGFKKRLIKENERGIAELEENCLTDKDFIVQIGTLATLVDDFDEGTLHSCLKEKYEPSGSLDLLEKFLEENALQKGKIIENLRYIKRIRNTLFPIHRGTSSKFFTLMRELDFKPPLDWNNVWKACLAMYTDSLAELSKRLDEYNFRIEYQKEIEEQRIKKSERHEGVIYLNDILYKYRVLVPVDFKYKMEMLVDYLTAAIIAYDKNLKSMNYALKKYVIPLKDKFREHAEDVYFVKKRRILQHDFLQGYGIILSRDDIGIRDEKEFQRYFRHVYASVLAYHMGVTPDWFISYYASAVWGTSWLGKR